MVKFVPSNVSLTSGGKQMKLTFGETCTVNNFTNILQTAFAPIFFKQKITNTKLYVHKSFVKHFCMKKLLLNVGEIYILVNFISILQAAFVQIFFCQKNQSQNVSRNKFCKTLLYKKVASRMLMKLTPGVNFIKI
jgi:hypothetical protein